MTTQKTEPKYIFYLISAIFALLAVAFLLRKFALDFAHWTYQNSDAGLFNISFQLSNLIGMTIYISLFGYLGYKASKKRKLNEKKWAAICAVLGIWGYLYLVMFNKPNKNIV